MQITGIYEYGGTHMNIVYMFADQLRLASCGYVGDKRAKTPNIDALAAESCDVRNAVSGHPVCAPYRASLFTGKYTTSTGMVINEIRINTAHDTLAKVLCRNGYEASYIGKWHMYANELGNHFDPKNSYIPAGPDRLGFDGFFAGYNFHHENYGEHSYYHLNSPEKLSYGENAYEPDAQTDMAIAELERLAGGDKPFALFLSLGTPHDPWDIGNVPPEWYEKFRDVDFELCENYLPDNDPHADAWARLSEKERGEITDWMKVYYAMVANVDYNVGRMRDAIAKLGLTDDTLFVFTSDHGELFGAHGRRAKNIFYEEAVRVPFLMHYPKKLPVGVNDVCLNTVDIMPTLLSMCGLEIPEEVEGRDLSAALCGEENAFKPDGALMMCTGATADWTEGVEWRAFRTEKYTYARFLSDGMELFFDNENDPLQMNNLAGRAEYAGEMAKVKGMMEAEMVRVNDQFHPVTYYKENWVVDRIIQKIKAD